MVYSLIYTKKAEKQLTKIDNKQANKILKWLDSDVDGCKDPRKVKTYKKLLHEYKGSFRYRVGDYRAICEEKKDRLIITALFIAHRKNAYE